VAHPYHQVIPHRGHFTSLPHTSFPLPPAPHTLPHTPLPAPGSMGATSRWFPCTSWATTCTDSLFTGFSLHSPTTTHLPHSWDSVTSSFCTPARTTTAPLGSPLPQASALTPSLCAPHLTLPSPHHLDHHTPPPSCLTYLGSPTHCHHTAPSHHWEVFWFLLHSLHYLPPPPPPPPWDTPTPLHSHHTSPSPLLHTFCTSGSHCTA